MYWATNDQPHWQILTSVELLSYSGLYRNLLILGKNSKLIKQKCFLILLRIKISSGLENMLLLAASTTAIKEFLEMTFEHQQTPKECACPVCQRLMRENKHGLQHLS